jgi:hypothetical protein
VNSRYEEDDLILKPYMVPVKILPQQYAVKYNRERGEVTFEFCSLRLTVSTKNESINYFLILTGFHRSITNVSRSARERQLSDFKYLMGTEIYKRSCSRMTYMQQKENHDLSVTFEGISCTHQLGVGNFDSDCENCVLS